MNAIKRLREEIALNKAILCELDAEIAKIASHQNANVLPDDALESNQMPFFYGVVGNDKQPGIHIPPGALAQVGAVYSGRIPIQNDGPFICTDILMTGQFFNGRVGNNGKTLFQPLAVVAGGLSDVGFRFTVEGSQRALFQNNSDNETTKATAFIPASVFNYGFMTASSIGPSATFKVPEALILAKNDVVRVDIKLDVITEEFPAAFSRIFVTFLGYKVLEA